MRLALHVSVLLVDPLGPRFGLHVTQSRAIPAVKARVFETEAALDVVHPAFAGKATLIVLILVAGERT